MERDNSITVTGQFPVRDANKEFGWNLPEGEDAVTLAGFITENLERIPELGETVDLYGIQFKIIMKRKQGITKLRANAIEAEVKSENISSETKHLKHESSDNT
jgi:Mg2+/Co2+ transporter CorB